ncbi:MAG: flagellar biosynthesis protein FlhF [Pirellulales bacterium]
MRSKPTSEPDIRTFRATSLREALTAIREELGPDADIRRTREVPAGGLWNRLTGKTVIEITAAPFSSETRVARVEDETSFVGMVEDDALPGAAPSLDPHGAGTYDMFAHRAFAPSEPPETHEPSANDSKHRTIDEIAARLNVAYRDPDAPSTAKAFGAQRKASSPIVNWPESCFELYNALIDVDVEPAIARELINDVRHDANERELASVGALRRLRRRMAAELHVSGPVHVPADERRVVALVGPTGVGKTTTIAKLAANARLLDKRRVGLLTMDTYRIAAVDQLRSYAEIIDLPLAVATTPEEARDAIRRMNDLELILVDTAGRSPNNAGQMDDLRAMLAAIRPDETHLVLSSSSSAINLEQTAAKFKPAGYTHVLLTKVDEASALGHVLTAPQVVGVPISYLTTGQNVPDDIETAESLLLAERILPADQSRRAA